jgi:hypothetical protein
MVSNALNYIDNQNAKQYIKDLKQIIGELDALTISIEK